MKPWVPSQTAERVALVRAIESLRPEDRRICSDPYARHFLQGRTKRIYHLWPLRLWFQFTCERYLPGVIGAVLLRTRYIDDWLAAQISAGVRQVVNLGAGYDTRALRFAAQLKTVRVFEVDHPATQNRKKRTLKSLRPTLPDNLVFVPICFNREPLGDKLAAAGYRQDRPTAFLWEGVTYYISRAAVEQTLSFVAAFSALASSIVFDFFPPDVVEGRSHLKEGRVMHQLFKGLGEAINFGIAEDQVHQFLAERGFGRIRVLSSRDLKATYLARDDETLKVSAIFSMAQAAVR